jgi:hypothetical protein
LDRASLRTRYRHGMVFTSSTAPPSPDEHHAAEPSRSPSRPHVPPQGDVPLELHAMYFSLLYFRYRRSPLVKTIA